MDFRNQRWNSRLLKGNLAERRPVNEVASNLFRPFNVSGTSPVIQMVDLTFTYVITVSMIVATAEFLTIFILKQARIFFQIRYLSISFLAADSLFRVVSIAISLTKILIANNVSDKNVLGLKLFMQFGNGITNCIVFSSIAIMSWDRVVALAWPLRYRVFVTKRKIMAVVLITWIGNGLVYSCLVVDYFLLTASKNMHGYLKAPRKSRTTTLSVRFDLNKEHTVLTILLTSYELLNVLGCCILTYQIRKILERRKARLSFFSGLQKTFRQTGLNNSFVSNDSNQSTSESRHPNRPAEESTEELNTSFENNCQLSTSNIFALQHSETKIDTKSPTAAKLFYIKQEVTSNDIYAIRKRSGLSAKTNSTYSNEDVVKTSKLAVTKVILTVAFLQFCFHLPYIVGHIARLNDGTKSSGTGILKIVSRILLQLGTVPSLYIFVLKLRECQAVFLKLFCFSCKKGANRA